MQVWCLVLFTDVVFSREVSLVFIFRHCKGSVVVNKLFPIATYFCLGVQRQVDSRQIVPDVTLVTRHFPVVYGGVVSFFSSDGEGVNSDPVHVVVHRQAVGFCLFKWVLKTNTFIVILNRMQISPECSSEIVQLPRGEMPHQNYL